MDMEQFPKREEANYQAQVKVITASAKSLLQSTGKLSFGKDGIAMAPVVAKIDFQNTIKLQDVNARALSEYKSWWSIPHGVWGFEYSVNNADKKIARKMKAVHGMPVRLSAEANKLKASSIDFPVYGVNLNNNLPSMRATVVSKKEPAFDAEDGLKVAQADLKGAEGAVFFPYINLTFKKQGTGLTQMHGERILNYEAAINGYFQLCDNDKCVSAKIPNNKGISFIMPLVSIGENNEENQQKAQKYAQELLGDIISEITIVALNKLVTIE
jgi:hypothetical protein